MTVRGVFVTGTDTEVGKTRISVGLIAALQQQGLKVAAMKPVASGCETSTDGLRNADAMALLAQADVKTAYQTVNPYAFAPAIAPHIAAEQTGIKVESTVIMDRFRQLAAAAEFTVVEGAGGWLVPINAQQTLADIAHAMQLPVVLVVAIKLGCINHALLTVSAVQAMGLPLAGWVANCLHPEAESSAIIKSLQQRVSAPCLGVVPHLSPAQSAAGYLNVEAML